MRDKIFFNPPIRESWQVKAMFKWINRWVTAWIYIKEFNEEVEKFLWNCILEEKIFPLALSKVIKYNLIEILFIWYDKNLVVKY